MENNQRDSLVRPGERVDDLQNGYYVIQNPQNSVLEWMRFCSPVLQK